MATLQFANGQEVEVKGNPSPADVEHIASQIGVSQDNTDSSDTTNQSMAGYEMPQPGTRGVAAVPKGLARGVYKGGLGILDTLGNLGEMTGNVNAQTPIVGQNFRDLSRQTLDSLIPPVKGVIANTAEGLGELSGTAVQLEAGGELPMAAKLGILGAINSQKGGIGSMATEGAKQALIGQLLEMASGIKNPAMSGIAGAGIMGGAAKLQGASNDQAVSQAVIGGGLGMLGNQATEPAVNKMAKDLVSNPTGIFKATIDKVGEAQKKANSLEKLINQEETDLKNQQVGVQTQNDFNKKSVNSTLKSRTDAENALIESQKSQSQRDMEARQIKVGNVSNQKAAELQSQIQTLQARFPEEAVAQAKFVQDNLPSMKKETYSNYGNFLDNMASTIDLTVGDSADSYITLLNDVKSKIGESRGVNPQDSVQMRDLSFNDKIVQGIDALKKKIQALNPLEALKEQYPVLHGLDFTDPVTVENFKADNPSLARQIDEVTAYQASNPTIPFKQLYRQMREVIKSDGYKSSSAGIFASELGDFISNKTGNQEFKNAQGSYKVSISYLNKLSELFSLKKGEANLARGATFLEKVPGARIETASDLIDKRIYDYLRTGKADASKYQLNKGLGPIADRIAQFRANIDVLHEEMGKQKDVLSQRMTDIAQAHLQRIADLDKAGELTIRKYNQIKTTMEAKFQQELAKQQMQLDLVKKSNIANKKMELQKIQHSITRTEALISAIITATGGFGGVFWKLSKFARGGLMAEKVERKYGS